MRMAFLSLLAILSGIVGCNTSATDNTVLEPTRDQRIDSMASEACSRYEACNGYGSGKKYASSDACKQDYKTKATEAWSVDKCSSGRINNANYLSCVDSVKQVACTGDIWDAIIAAGKCGPDKVCTDPAK